MKIGKSLRSIAIALSSASMVCLSGYSSMCEAKPIGASGWLQSAKSSFGPATFKTPPLTTANGPIATPHFETANSALIVDGNQTETEVDFQTGGLYPLKLVRTYNHLMAVGTLFDNGWATNLDVHLGLRQVVGHGVSTIWAYRPDGSQVEYDWNGTDLRNSSPDADDWFLRNSDGTFTLMSKSGAVENYNANGYVTSIKDPTGIGYTFTYDASNHLQSANHTNGQSITFGWSGNLVSWVKDPAGSTYNYAYSANGKLTSVTYPNGDVKTYTYENYTLASAGLTSISVNGKLYKTFSYNSDGTVHSSGFGDGSIQTQTFSYGSLSTSVTNAMGAVTTYTYALINSQPKISQVTTSGITNSPSETVSYSYDGVHPQLFTDARGIKTHYVYSSDGLIQDMKTGDDPANPGQERETKYTWDDTKNRLNEVQTLDASGSPINDTVYSYYPDSSTSKNRLQTVTAKNQTANGITNQTQTTNYSYQFYGSGIPSRIVAAGPGGQYTQNYDTFGRLTSVVDGAGNTTSYSAYNALNLVGSVTDPNGFTVSYGYDALGRVASASRTLDGTTTSVTYFYDALGNSLGINLSDGSYITYDRNDIGQMTFAYTNLCTGQGPLTGWECYIGYSYDALGNMIGKGITLSATSVLHHTTTNTYPYTHSWTYDSIGRLTSDNGANGQKLQYSYDADGNVATVTDSLSRITRYTYNANNQVQTITDPLTQVTRFGYDGAGNLSSVTDPKTNVTDYYYDGLGNLTALTSPDTGVTSYIHDSLGRVTQMTRNNGAVTLYTGYDALNRPHQIQADSQTIGYTYDACVNGKGRLCGVTDSSGSTSFGYRQNGQLTSQNSVINGASYGTGWVYDNRDRVSSITYPGGNQVNYAYDTQSHITGITATIGGTTSPVITSTVYTAHGLGPMTSMGMGDGTITSLAYDGDYRLASLRAGSFQSLTYNYDTANSLTKITNGVNSNLTQTYGYDPLTRLNSVTAGVGNQSLIFDANSTPTSFTWGGATDTVTPDGASNRISNIAGVRARSFGYDTLGNVTSITGWPSNRSFGYDTFNRMSSVNNGGAATTYTSNAFNQRVRKSGPGGTFNYVYAPAGALLGETSNGGTALTTEYIWLGSTPIGLIRNGALYFVHGDHLGGPDTVTNSSGAVVWQAANTAFDRVVTTDNIGGLNLGFPGQYYDGESDLYYNLNRYYDHTTGRYISSDPLGLNGGLNTYSYALDASSMYSDRTGQLPDPFEVGAGIIAGGVGGYIAGGTAKSIVIGAVAGGVTAFFLSPLLSEEEGAAAYAIYRSKVINMTASNISGQTLANSSKGYSPVEAVRHVNYFAASTAALGGATFGTAAKLVGGVSTVTVETFAETEGATIEHLLESGKQQEAAEGQENSNSGGESDDKPSDGKDGSGDPNQDCFPIIGDGTACFMKESY